MTPRQTDAAAGVVVHPVKANVASPCCGNLDCKTQPYLNDEMAQNPTNLIRLMKRRINDMNSDLQWWLWLEMRLWLLCLLKLRHQLMMLFLLGLPPPAVADLLHGQLVAAVARCLHILGFLVDSAARCLVDPPEAAVACLLHGLPHTVAAHFLLVLFLAVVADSLLGLPLAAAADSLLGLPLAAVADLLHILFVSLGVLFSL